VFTSLRKVQWENGQSFLLASLLLARFLFLNRLVLSLRKKHVAVSCAVAPAALAIKIDVTRTIIFFGSCNEFPELAFLVVVVVVVVLAFLVLGNFVALALHLEISLAFVPRVGMYPSRSNFFL
jgi:hypothetical protein